MRIMIFSDAGDAQVNGVVTTLANTKKCLEDQGHVVEMVVPSSFKWSFACPSYPEIRLAIASVSTMHERIRDFQPDSIHIATEGPIGIQAVRTCKKYGYAFTTSYHTKMPEYINKRCKYIPVSFVYSCLRWLHDKSSVVLVTTASMKNELETRGFKNIVVWGRGADLTNFYPGQHPLNKMLRALYVGRVSVEKNLEAFLDIPGCHKVIVGDGPDLAKLKQKYADDSHVQFLGKLKGERLASQYRQANVFVFPSKTDTFGIVMIEAVACGTPVAAYPVTGPIDFVQNGVTGVLSEDLSYALHSAAGIDRVGCAEEGRKYTWEACTKTFLENLISAKYIL